jgi:hypothetical protein
MFHSLRSNQNLQSNSQRYSFESANNTDTGNNIIFVSCPQQNPLLLQVPITIGTTVSDSCNVSCTVNNFINAILNSKDHPNNKAQKIYMKTMWTPALTAPFPLSFIWDLILCYWHTHYLPERSEI